MAGREVVPVYAASKPLTPLDFPDLVRATLSPVLLPWRTNVYMYHVKALL